MVQKIWQVRMGAWKLPVIPILQAEATKKINQTILLPIALINRRKSMVNQEGLNIKRMQDPVHKANTKKDRPGKIKIGKDIRVCNFLQGKDQTDGKALGRQNRK